MSSVTALSQNGPGLQTERDHARTNPSSWAPGVSGPVGPIEESGREENWPAALRATASQEYPRTRRPLVVVFWLVHPEAACGRCVREHSYARGSCSSRWRLARDCISGRQSEPHFGLSIGAPLSGSKSGSRSSGRSPSSGMSRIGQLAVSSLVGMTRSASRLPSRPDASSATRSSRRFCGASAPASPRASCS